MKLDRKAGWALVVSNEAIRQVGFKMDDPRHPYFSSRQSGYVEFGYSPLADVYYWQDSDGMSWYAAIHVLATADDRESLIGADGIDLPSMDEIAAGKSKALAIVSKAIARGDIDSDEIGWQMAFSNNLISTPASIYAEWRLIDDVGQAQQSLIRKDLGMHAEFVQTIRNATEEQQ